MINETNWNNLITENVNNLYNNINEKFKEIYEKSKIHKKPIKKRSTNPWISDDLVKCCEYRDKLFKKWKSNKRNQYYELQYKQYRNKINKKIVYAKNNYYRQKFVENRKNPRVTWQLINEIQGKTVNNIDDIILKNFKNYNIEDILKNFAINFNANVIKIIHKCDVKTNIYPEKSLQNSMYMEQTSIEEIFNILTNLNAKKGAGIDGIRPKDIKNNAAIFTPILTKLINQSICSSTVPNLLKTSVIRPIYKSGHKDDVNSYRPIAILSVIEKILEEVIVKRLNTFLNKFKIINPNQYGFQKEKNINQLLGKFADTINNALSKVEYCLVLFIDFSKAFDTLSHTKLLSILARNGIRGNVLSWFVDYLNLRSYRVKINNKNSEETMSYHGVPQGSKLGPILYLIYANDMLNTLKDCYTYAYADDTAIVVTNKNIEIATKNMQNQLNDVSKWCHDNGLVINASKTKLMHIRQPNMKQINIQLKYHDIECIHNKTNDTNDSCNTSIELVNIYKYLGVYVDNTLKWKTHIRELQKKLRKVAYSLYHLSYAATYTVLRQAYFSLAESYMRHGITAWGNSAHCKSLQQTQNRLLKILWSNQLYHQNTIRNTNNNTRLNNATITNTNSNISKTLPSELKVLNIKNIYRLTVLTELYESRLLQTIDHQYNTRLRSDGRFKIETTKNSYGDRTLKVILPTIYNELPHNLRNITNAVNRKITYKKYLISLQ